MVMLTQVNINSVDVTSTIVSYNIERIYGDAITQLDMVVDKTISDLITLNNALTIEIWRGYTTPTDLKVFDGRIENYMPEGGRIKIIGKDKIWDLIKKEVTKTYDSGTDATAGKISALFDDLARVQGGLNADSGTIQDSGTVFVIAKFICNHADIFERCKNLASALDWQFYYRPDTDKVYFEPKGFTSNTTVLTVGDNVIGVPKWNYDTTEMVNDLTVTGAFSQVETVETGQIGVTANYTTASVLLTGEPASTKVFSDASNPPTTLREGGVEGISTPTFFYSVDEINKKILPRTTTTFTSSHYLQTNYSKKIPVALRLFVQSSIDLYTQFKKTINFPDIKTVNDANTRGQNYLLRYAVPFKYTTLKATGDATTNFFIGQLIQVIDDVSTPTVNTFFVINRHIIRYPGDYEELYVGDKEWRIMDWQGVVEERLKRFEEESLENVQVSVEQVNVDLTTSNPISIIPRYRKIGTQTSVSGNLFILSSPAYGILGTNKFGGSLDAEIPFYMQQFQNILEEFFTDTDFKDGTTTASWTNDGTLDFTSGQIARSKSIDFSNGTITAAKLTATISSGTFTLAMAADGSTFETVTSGASHAFGATGTDLQWKITESGASTGTITHVKIEGYH